MNEGSLKIVILGAAVVSAPEVTEAGRVCVPERTVADVIDPISEDNLVAEAAADAESEGEAEGDMGKEPAAALETAELAMIE